MTWAFRMPVGEIDTAGQCGRASAVQQPEVRIHPLRRVTGQFVVEVLVVARDEGDIAWQSAEPVSNAARSCGFDVSLFTISGASVSQRACFSAAARDQRHSRVGRVECLCVVASGQGPAVQAASSAASGLAGQGSCPRPCARRGSAQRTGRDHRPRAVPALDEDVPHAAARPLGDDGDRFGLVTAGRPVQVGAADHRAPPSQCLVRHGHWDAAQHRGHAAPPVIGRGAPRSSPGGRSSCFGWASSTAGRPGLVGGHSYPTASGGVGRLGGAA